MKITYSFVKILILLIVFASCSDETETEQKKTYLGEPTIKFSKTTHNFGTLQEGEIVECVFKYTNTGEGMLRLLSVEADCGCTVPEFSTDALAPGDTGKIRVQFNSEGFRNTIRKTIDVETNTKESYIELKLNAYIENNNSLK